MVFSRRVRHLLIFFFLHAAQFIAGMGAPIMAPAGRAKKVIPTISEGQALFPDVFPDISPFVEDNIDRALVLQRFGDAIFDLLVFPGG